MAGLVNTTADFNTTLALKVAIGATTATLTSATDNDGVALPTGTYGFTIDRKNSSKEYIECTLTGVNLTNVKTIARGTGIGTAGFARAHRKGAEVIISDFVAIKRIKDVLEDGYASATTPTTDYMLATKKYVDDLAFGGSVSIGALTVAGTAGETIAAGNLVYLKVADGYWWKTDADTAATIDGVQLGIAQGSGTAGNAITSGVLLSGIDSNQSGGTIGAYGYASNTAGAIGNSAGTTTKIVGQFKTATTFYFDPEFYSNPSVNEKLAMAGGSTFGTPSSTNKFATTDYVSPIMVRFGSGVDGDVTISGNTTLTRDMFYNNLTVNSGIVLTTGGFRIFVKETCTINGTIERNGGNGASGVDNSAGNGGTLADGTLKGSVNGGAGGAGGGDGVAGTVGDAGTAATECLDASNGVAGAAGGRAGSSGALAGAGGAGGATTASVQKLVPLYTVETVSFLNTSGAQTRFNVSAAAGGGGGGGGGSTGTGRPGGGGGGGGSTGGILLIVANAIVIGASGAITALGGNGGNGGNGDSDTGECGGGGGGGSGGNGGIIILEYRTLTNNGSSNILVTGGTGGTGGSGGSGDTPGQPGSNGSAGADGTVYEFNL